MALVKKDAQDTMDLDEIQNIRSKIGPDQKIVFIYGVFNVIHSGHLRLMNFGAECGDVLIIGVRPNGHPGAIVDQTLRLESAQSLSVVQHAFIMESPLEKVLETLRPDIVVKGKEHENEDNPEKEIIESYDGKLMFGSSASRFSTIELLRSENEETPITTIQKPDAYHKRHQFTMKSLEQTVRKFKDLNVVVIGDLIVDEYIACEALGMSQEDPTLVVSPLTSQSFLGGAGIVAAHACGLGANAHYVTITGQDNTAGFATQKLTEYGVDHTLIVDTTRPTTSKKRYRAQDKTLLRINDLRQHEITNELCGQVLESAKEKLQDADLLIFSDFNYGCLPQVLVEDIVTFCEEKNIMMVADSQASSQYADISRFKNMTLVTPTEREARLAMRDFSSGLVELIVKLQEESKAQHAIMTLGSEGVLVQTTIDSIEELRTDRIKAMNSAPKDVAGGGDSMLIASALAIAAGASVWEAAYIGSLAAAIQVGRLGNIPLKAEELIAEIER